MTNSVETEFTAEDHTDNDIEEDLSLTEYREDDTQLSSDSEISLSGGISSGEEELRLVDSDETATNSLSFEGQTLTSTTTPQTKTRTTGINLETLTNDGTITRSDSTSTRTYAPDNYDRTLMKLPSADESKIFAGMKADSDVVMTPDYAKKVFISKSSAQRAQYYRGYLAVVVIIFLLVGTFGLIQYQDESELIDVSLRPLKRDPLPGIIKPLEETSGISLVVEEKSDGVDSATLKLVQNASDSEQTDTTQDAIVPIAESEENTSTEIAANDSITPQSKSNDDQSELSNGSSDSSNVAKPVIKAEKGTVNSTLEISSSKELPQKDVLLSEAYNAYKEADYSGAMNKYNEVLEIDPRSRNALLGRAAINVFNNNTIAAIKDYQALLLENPKDSQAMTSMIAVANYSPEESETQLKIMIRDEPDSHYLNFALANVYGAQNRWSEAQSHYFYALESNPDNPNYAYNLAVSLEHIAQPASAINYYQLALENFDNGLATFDKNIVGERLEILKQL